MTAPDDIQPPSDVETGSLPTHTADGREVLGFDNGTSRPASAPIGAEAAPAGDAGNEQGGDAGDTTGGDVAAALAGLAGASDGGTQTPILMLPRGIDFSQVMALTHIVNRRGEQDAKWGGIENDDQKSIEDWLHLIEGYLNQAEAASQVGEIDTTIDKLIDAAALTTACLEAHLRRAERLDQSIAKRLNEEAADSADSTGDAGAADQLSGGADEADSSVDAGGGSFAVGDDVSDRLDTIEAARS